MGYKTFKHRNISIMHVLFDLDGTLTDPKEGIIACFMYALTSLEIETDQTKNLESYIGQPIREVFCELCGDELAEKSIVIYRERFSTIGLYENRLYDGIVECLDYLVDKVEALYVVTSKPTVYSEQIVKHFNIRDFFKVVYGSNLDGSLGDKTDLIKHVIETEGINPNDAVMIGDRKFDIIGAKNHGIRTIGVLWGFGTEQELNEAGADRICGHPSCLHDHIFI